MNEDNNNQTSTNSKSENVVKTPLVDALRTYFISELEGIKNDYSGSNVYRTG